MEKDYLEYRFVVISDCRGCKHRNISYCTLEHRTIRNIDEIPQWCRLSTLKEFYRKLKEEEDESN